MIVPFAVGEVLKGQAQRDAVLGEAQLLLVHVQDHSDDVSCTRYDVVRLPHA